MKSLVMLAIVVLIALPCGLAQSSVAQIKSAAGSQKRAAEVASFAGCYELKRGRWWPWGFGKDDSVTPPRHIQLLSERGTHGFEQGELLIRAIPPPKEIPSGIRDSSYWQVKPKDRVELSWTTGFVGVTLDLRRKGNELSGWAHPHFDAIGFVRRIAHATARRIPCDVPDSKP
ncbi:MAG: hypothetical protein ACYDCD_08570 [Candidatus Acidiferrales bacterium]